MTPVAVPAQAARPAAGPAAGGERATAPPVAPNRAELADAALIVALTLTGIIGFRGAYGGTAYLIAGVSGVILGLALSHIGQRARVPLLGITAIGVLAFVLLGGLASAGFGIGAGLGNTAIPTLATMHAVLLAAVSGWKDLLTTAQPVGTTGHLLALPYLLGIASGVTAHALARRTRAVLLPAAPPAGVVALSILFGASHVSAPSLPVGTVIQGAGFAALALAWAAIRQQRGIARLTTIGRQRPWQRLGAAAAVLAVAAGGAVFLGPRLPGASAHQRVVLRAVPPFDVATYPSPLAMFRDYTTAVTEDVGLNGKLLLSVSGLAAGGGSQIRIATMDSYDGTAWGVANAQASESTFAGFQSVGATLPGQEGAAPRTGPGRSVTITIDKGYQQPWLPSLPAATSLRFTGPQATALQGQLRYNVATGTGVVPGNVPQGVRYTVTAPPAAPSAGSLRDATPFDTPDLAGTGIQVPAAVTTFAAAHSGGAVTPMAKVMALAAYLKSDGHYSDGGSGQAQVFAGHGAGRIASFLQDLTGDDEQYAAAMALLANAVGVPARVTLDAAVEPGGAVYGKDVHANIELDLAQYGWVPLPVTDFLGNKAPVPQPKKTPRPAPARAVPQQQPNAAPVTGNTQSSAISRGAPPPKGSGFHIPRIVVTLLTYAGIPLAVLIALVAGLRGAKGVRRRRRGTGPPVARVAGAWAELVDLGRDLGIAPQPSLTRRELCTATAMPFRHGPGGQPALGSIPGALDVAVAADAAMFAPGDPGAAAADQVWALVARARKGALAGLPRWRRAWVAVNPASLLPGTPR